jgi:hypothetical protein
VNRTLFAKLASLFALGAFLSGCGSSSHSAPPPPTFTSTPSTTAVQDTLYSYNVTATDPKGGTVSFALTTAPTGATLTSAALAWTPPAAQSRVSNSFTITATTSEGGTASQSWTVTPAGTITANWIDTAWTPTGSVPVPNIAPASTVSALVPQSDGLFLAVAGVQTNPGVWTLPAIPAGYFWLATGSPIQRLFWTSMSTIDLGIDFSRSTAATLAQPQTTKFDLNLSGLNPANSSSVAFVTDTAAFPRIFLLPGGTTTFSASYAITTVIDWSQVPVAFLNQYVPQILPATPPLQLNLNVLDTELTLNNPGWINGGTNTVNAALLSATKTTAVVTVNGSQWPPLFTNVAPSTTAPTGTGLVINTQPYVTGVNSKQIASNIQLVNSDSVPGLIGACAAVPLQPPITTDQSFGTLTYGDPFPAGWTRALTFCEGSLAQIQLPNTNNPIGIELLNSFSEAPSNDAYVPTMGPVQSPTINGASLFTAATLNTTAVSLSWSAPALGTPFGYTISVLQQTTVNGQPALLSAGVFTTGKTTATLPPLTAGNTYVIEIAARADAGANVETKPNRSALPTAFADVVSAPITIASGAASAPIRGNRTVIRNFGKLQPVDRIGALLTQ